MIPLIDLRRQYKTIQKDIKRAMQSVIDNTDFILGKEVGLFESEFAAYCNSRFCVAVDSGTGALELGLMALGVGAGEEVIVPSFTFYARASAVAAVGARPVFVDVLEETGNINPALLEQAITAKTKAILVVHLFGQPVDLAPILKIARKFNLPLIEDSAQAHGAQVQIDGQWQSVGSVGILSCFSFYPGKNLGAYGDGGAVITSDGAIAEKLRLLRDYGRTGKYEHSILGYNKRLDSLQAAILRVKLKNLDLWNQKRRKIADLYDKLFKRSAILPFKIMPFAQPVRHVYAVRLDRRDAFAEYMKQKGVATGVHYPIPLHLQKAFGYLGYKKGDLPVSEKIADSIVSLPIFAELKSAEIRQIAQTAKDFYAQ